MKGCIKRTLSLLAAMVLTGGMTVFASDGTEAVYTLTQEGNALSMAQEESPLTFWEAPDVVTGQTRMNGTITLKNESLYTTDFVLSSVSLPYDNPEALAYLDAVSVDISDGETVLYHDRFTRLMDGDRAEIRVEAVAPGTQKQLKLMISCSYTYTGQVPSYSSLVWSFTPQIREEPPMTTAADPLEDTRIINWLLIVEIAGALVVVTGTIGVIRWLTRRHKHNPPPGE